MDSRAPMSRLDVLLQDIDLPERAYELANNRYQDLAKWLSRPDSALMPHDAHLFVQGSFALGTTIRPINDDEEYDLDFSCKLRQGISRDTHTQKQLKDLVGRELAAYRHARQINRPLQPKNRCWRLGYKDELPFHLDVVPGLRTDDAHRRALLEQMTVRGTPAPLAQQIARKALWITDQQHPQFEQLTREWPSSNPGGYQQWFLSRMQPEQKRVLAEADVDPVPVYRAKTPLQKAVQLLKRHRDFMFVADSDRKPASIIITTIAGEAYRYGESLTQTLHRVLQALDVTRRSDTDSVLNPVNPAENFADRWQRPDCQHLQLKRNFHQWVNEANRHFAEFLDSPQAARLAQIAEDNFGLKVAATAFNNSLPAVAAAAATSRTVTLASPPARPWRG